MARAETDILRDAEIIYNFHASRSGVPGNADLILAAGSHDMRVPEHAARLFLEGCAPLLVCSGGFGKITDGLFCEPEGILFRKRCIELGVPEASVLAETRASNTGENFTLSRDLLLDLGLHPETGIIVCKPYMSQRTWAAASKQWPEVSWRVSAPPIAFSDYFSDDAPLQQEIELMTGDLQRLRVYAERGYQEPVEVPAAVWDAYDRLVQDGFDRYVIRQEEES